MIFYCRIAPQACGSCLGHPISTKENETDLQKTHAEEEAFFFGENYQHGLTVKWELRSGDWNFMVPYCTEDTTVTYRHTSVPGGRTVTVSPWWKMVNWTFLQDEKYTGEFGAYGFPANAYNQEIGCDLDAQNSKYDKIMDFQMKFPTTTNYDRLKESNQTYLDFTEEK